MIKVHLNRWATGCWRGACAALVVVVSLTGAVVPVQADSYSAYVGAHVTAAGLTATFFWNTGQEKFHIDTAWKAYLFQQRNKTPAVPRVGQAAINGDFPTSFLGTGHEGVLTFHFVDTTTELLADGPSVDEVVYEWDTDPTDFAISWSPLGSSTDAMSDFPLAFIPPGPYPYEPIIKATPYYQGNPVVILGVDDENVAVGVATALVPEPASWIYCVTCAVALIGCRRKLFVWRSGGR